MAIEKNPNDITTPLEKTREKTEETTEEVGDGKPDRRDRRYRGWHHKSE